MRALFVTVLSLAALACGDSSAPRAVPTSIDITTPATAGAAAGLPLTTSPAFVVRDQNGNAMSGVPVTVAVTAGGGFLANAPAASSSASTSVGTWTLGRLAGANSLTITVSGIAPVLVTVNSLPGAPSKLVAITPTNLAGTVGQLVAASISASLRDQFDNPVPGIELTVTVSGGGSSVPNVTTDGNGTASIPTWSLGTTKGTQTLTLYLNSVSVGFSAAAAAGPLQSLDILSGNNQSGLAGKTLTQGVLLAAVDQYGNRLDNQTASFAVLSGGGSLSSGTALTAVDGSIAMPSFTLGKSALPQSISAAVGTKSVTVNASVISNYAMDIRFWGPSMTADQQALFVNAAARIRGIVVGSVPTVDGTGADPAVCGVTGEPVLSENIPGVIIYASVQAIDGPGKILAQAGPCYTRGAADNRTAIGIMEFDIDDLTSLSAGGSLQDVITHEMLHVVGVGSFWNNEGLLTGYNTSTVAYTGTGGIAGCRETGGTTSCATAVPVENTGGSGTANSHWREAVFGGELMTGYANAGPMPLSIMTVRSLGDIGYTINTSAADLYSIFIGSVRANQSVSTQTPVGTPWEKGPKSAPRVLPSRNRNALAGSAK
jgi:hypothetical protein